jgi:hypothetical protein
MAGRHEVAAAIKELQSSPAFRTYISTLESAMDDVMTKILLPESIPHLPELLGEARCYRDILKTLVSNIR